MKFKYFLPARLGGLADNFWLRAYYNHPKLRPFFELIAGPYEKDVVNFYQKHAPYGVSVDIGAGVGYHTRKLAKISNRVIAIEPLADLVGMPDNVEIHKVAVGRKYGYKRMSILGTYTNGSIGASSSLLVRGENQKMVEVVPLDKIVTEADFLKIDTEGYELEILEPSSILDSVNFAVIELHDVKDLIDYQTRIFRLLKNFQVFASEIKSYVTIDDVPLKERRDRNTEQYGNLNNHRLLCMRKGWTT